MTEFTSAPPFADNLRTGRAFITPCCTAGTREYLIDGVLWLVFSVAGHGYAAPRQGSIDDINDTGTKVDADGTERRVWWKRTPGEE